MSNETKLLYTAKVKLERQIKGYKAIVLQEGDAINSPFILEIYVSGKAVPEHREQLSFPVAFAIWKKWGVKPVDFLFEEAENYINDKNRNGSLTEWAKTL